MSNLWGVLEGDDRLYGFVDTKGEEVIPFRWTAAYGFAEGLAAVRGNSKNGQKWGFIDRDGNGVIDLKWDSVTSFSSGLAAVEKDGKHGAINKKGEVVIPLEWDDLANSKTTPRRPGFSEGLASVKKGEKWGYIDPSGKIVIKPQWKLAEGFSEGFAKVGDAKHSYDNEGVWGFIDRTGRVVIPVSLTGDVVSNVTGGLIRVRRDGKEGCLNTQGEEVIPVMYDRAFPSPEGVVVVQQGGKWGFLDQSGKAIVPIEWDSAAPFSEGLGYVEKGDFKGFIDRGGKVVIDLAEVSKQLPPTFPIPSRRWTNMEGRNLTAEALRLEGENVIFKMNDEEVPYPISQLSAEDQSILKRAGELEK